MHFYQPPNKPFFDMIKAFFEGHGTFQKIPGAGVMNIIGNLLQLPRMSSKNVSYDHK